MLVARVVVRAQPGQPQPGQPSRGQRVLDHVAHLLEADVDVDGEGGDVAGQRRPGDDQVVAQPAQPLPQDGDGLRGRVEQVLDLDVRRVVVALACRGPHRGVGGRSAQVVAAQLLRRGRGRGDGGAGGDGGQHPQQQRQPQRARVDDARAAQDVELVRGPPGRLRDGVRDGVEDLLQGRPGASPGRGSGKHGGEGGQDRALDGTVHRGTGSGVGGGQPAAHVVGVQALQVAAAGRGLGQGPEHGGEHAAGAAQRRPQRAVGQRPRGPVRTDRGVVVGRAPLRPGQRRRERPDPALEGDDEVGAGVGVGHGEDVRAVQAPAGGAESGEALGGPALQRQGVQRRQVHGQPRRRRTAWSTGPMPEPSAKPAASASLT